MDYVLEAFTVFFCTCDFGILQTAFPWIQSTHAASLDTGRKVLFPKWYRFILKGKVGCDGSTIENRMDPWIAWRLEFMAPKALHFILEELLAWAPAPVLARHRYGCRVLDRLRSSGVRDPRP